MKAPGAAVKPIKLVALYGTFRGFVADRELWPRNSVVACVMDQFYGRAWMMRPVGPRNPTTKFAAALCARVNGHCDGSGHEEPVASMRNVCLMGRGASPCVDGKVCEN